jgi:hypothetical protein
MTIDVATILILFAFMFLDFFCLIFYFFYGIFLLRRYLNILPLKEIALITQRLIDATPYPPLPYIVNPHSLSTRREHWKIWFWKNPLPSEVTVKILNTYSNDKEVQKIFHKICRVNRFLRLGILALIISIPYTMLIMIIFSE